MQVRKQAELDSLVFQCVMSSNDSVAKVNSAGDGAHKAGCVHCASSGHAWYTCTQRPTYSQCSLLLGCICPPVHLSAAILNCDVGIVFSSQKKTETNFLHPGWLTTKTAEFIYIVTLLVGEKLCRVI